MSTSTQPSHDWREKHETQAENIGDFWEVIQGYLGNGAIYILFLTMVLNIVDSIPGIDLPGWLQSTVLIIQIVTLDAAGTALIMTGLRLQDKGHTKPATLGYWYGGCIVFITLITLACTLTANIFKDNPDIKTIAENTELALMFVRVVFITGYGFVLALMKKFIRDIKKEEAKQSTQAKQQQELDAVNTLQSEIATRLQAIEQAHKERFEKITQDVHTLLDRVNALQSSMYTSVDSVDKTVDIHQFQQLADIVSNLSVSVTEVHEHVHKITRTSSAIPNNGQLSLPERVPLQGYGHETSEDTHTDERSTPILPALQVPGMTIDKVHKVLSEYLTSHMSWTAFSKQFHYNYARDVKPIRDAYEAWQTENNGHIVEIVPSR